MFKPLRLILDTVVTRGSLHIETSDGATFQFGDATPPRVSVKFMDKRLERQIALNPNLAVAEGYMDGRLIMQEGRTYDLIALVLDNAMGKPLPRWALAADGIRYLTRRVAQYNPTSRARRNVQHHYDIDGRIYDLFLDAERQYSCAYYPTADTDLEDAQRAKIRHIAAKLAIGDQPRGDDGMRGARHHALGRAARLCATVGAEARPRQPGAVQPDRLPPT